MPNIKSYKTDVQFYKGSLEQVMLNYMTAKYEVKKWYTKEKLDKLIKGLNSCKSFEDAFSK